MKTYTTKIKSQVILQMLEKRTCFFGTRMFCPFFASLQPYLEQDFFCINNVSLSDDDNIKISGTLLQLHKHVFAISPKAVIYQILQCVFELNKCQETTDCNTAVKFYNVTQNR